MTKTETTWTVVGAVVLLLIIFRKNIVNMLGINGNGSTTRETSNYTSYNNTTIPSYNVNQYPTGGPRPNGGTGGYDGGTGGGRPMPGGMVM